MYEELLKIPTSVEYASEFRYKNPPIGKDTLVIAVSQSGETADTLAAVKEAKIKGAYTLAIVNVRESSIAKSADVFLHTKAGFEIAVATTKGYTTQLCMCYLLGIYLGLKLGKIGKMQSYELLKELKSIPPKMEEILSDTEQIKRIAQTIKEEKSVFFIGRNMDFAVALEASLKLKEISYIHSESYPSGELKHGTISLIEKGTVVFALSCYEKTLEKQFSNIKEVLARGGRVISCLSGEISPSFKGIGECFSVPKTNDFFTAALEVIPFQLLAFYVALFKDLDIDKPRNLAKSVTVE
jgi:glucosamine--fructose-6-phosphate aminotransferase (isomerizing)